MNPLSSALILTAMDRHLTLPANRPRFDDLGTAERLSAEIVAARRFRGERPRGYKIGFTNRSIWPLYGVHHPIWAPVYDSTVGLLEPGARASFEVTAREFASPRLEPEIVFGLARAPMSAEPDELVAAIDWYAHGFEIVQSVYPDWKFSGAEAFAAQGLHGALKVGERRPIAALGASAPTIAQTLAALRVTLSLNGESRAEGQGANVLDGPVLALSHLVTELARRGQHLQAGDIVTTGTLTDAVPLLPGQHWSTAFHFESDNGRQPAPISGLELHVK